MNKIKEDSYSAFLQVTDQLPPHCGIELIKLVSCLVEVHYQDGFDDHRCAGRIARIIKEIDNEKIS
jgi:hypothetical protein